MMCDLFAWLKPPTENGTWAKAVMLAVTVFKDFKNLQNTGPEDDFYHFPKAIEKWMEWCYACRSECPPYEYNTATEVGFNCDDFAKCFAAYCRRKKYSNAVWEVWGTWDGGGHAWNVVQCPEGKYEIEPQTGEVWEFGSKPNYDAILIK